MLGIGKEEDGILDNLYLQVASSIFWGARVVYRAKR